MARSRAAAGHMGVVREGELDRIRECRLQRPDGRTVAWVDWGDPEGIPLLRLPGQPGSRNWLRADRAPWRERGLRVLMTERPGFGASTPLPGRRFGEHADDLASILDAARIERAHVIGPSGAAPHILAFAERHPNRVAAATVISGIAPLEGAEVQAMIPDNVKGFEMALAGDLDGLRRMATDLRTALLEDPLAGIRASMATAPPADRKIIGDPAWQEAFVAGITEALRPGVQGWVDEDVAIAVAWDDIHPEAIETSITWWHSDADRNAPLSAARRLVDRLPNGRLHVWTGVGHLEGYRREPEILDELLGRP